MIIQCDAFPDNTLCGEIAIEFYRYYEKTRRYDMIYLARCALHVLRNNEYTTLTSISKNEYIVSKIMET